MHALATALANCPSAIPFHFNIQDFADSPAAPSRSPTLSPLLSLSLSLPQDQTPPPMGHSNEESHQQGSASEPLDATVHSVVVTSTSNSDHAINLGTIVPSTSNSDHATCLSAIVTSTSNLESTIRPEGLVVETATAQPTSGTALDISTSASVSSLTFHDPNAEFPHLHTPPLMQVNPDSPNVISPVISISSRSDSPTSEVLVHLNERPDDQPLVPGTGSPPSPVLVAPATGSLHHTALHPIQPSDSLKSGDAPVQPDAQAPPESTYDRPQENHGKPISSEDSSVGLKEKMVGGKKRGGKGSRKTRAKTGNIEELHGTKTKQLRHPRDASTAAKVQGSGPSKALLEKQVGHKRNRPVDEEVTLLDGRHGMIRKCKYVIT
jgi:hypothetical protein